MNIDHRRARAAIASCMFAFSAARVQITPVRVSILSAIKRLSKRRLKVPRPSGAPLDLTPT
jgi:hypothetical protein